MESPGSRFWRSFAGRSPSHQATENDGLSNGAAKLAAAPRRRSFQMTRIQRWFAVSAFLAASLAAQDDNKLPVKRVVLYKNGIGYFEHVGRVHDNQELTIPFSSGQLNDVLKSLT